MLIWFLKSPVRESNPGSAGLEVGRHTCFSLQVLGTTLVHNGNLRRLSLASNRIQDAGAKVWKGFGRVVGRMSIGCERVAACHDCCGELSSVYPRPFLVPESRAMNGRANDDWSRFCKHRAWDQWAAPVRPRPLAKASKKTLVWSSWSWMTTRSVTKAVRPGGINVQLEEMRYCSATHVHM